MKVTSKGQVTIPQEVRESMGIRPSESEVEFKQDESGRWYLSKITTDRKSRFRMAHNHGKVMMTTDEILALTRG